MIRPRLWFVCANYSVVANYSWFTQKLMDMGLEVLVVLPICAG